MTSLKRILDFLRIHWAIASLILLASPALLWWLKSGQIVSTTDYYFPLDPVVAFKKSLMLWDPAEITGSDSLAISLYAPRLAMFGLTSILWLAGFSLTALSKLWFFAFLLLPALFTYLLAREIEPKRPVFAFVAGAFVMYNPYMVNMITDSAIIMVMALVPAVIWLVMRQIRVGNPWFHGALIGVVSFLFPSFNPSSYSMGLILIVVGLLAIVFWQWRIDKGLKLRGIFQTLAIALGLGLLMNSSWIYATYLGIATGGTLPSGTGTGLEWAIGTSIAATFDRTIRLIGAWDWFSGYFDPYLPFAESYLKNPLAIIATWLIPVGAIIGIVLTRTRFTIALGISALLAALLAMGMHEPMTNIYSWLFTHVPFFWLFRSPWYKFSLPLLFCYAFLLGYAVDGLSHRLNQNRFLIPVVAGAILIFIITAYPLFLGQRFWGKEDRKVLPANRVTIPSYVYEFDDWLDSQPPGRVAAAEQLNFNTTNYTWGFGDLRPFLVDLAGDKGLIYNFYNTPVPAFPLIRHWNGHYWEDQFPGNTILNILNARYVLSQGDFNYTFFGPAFDQAKADERLARLDLELAKTFGPWKVYINHSAWPEAFMTESLMVIDSLEALKDLPGHPTAFTTTDSKRPESIASHASYSPIILQPTSENSTKKIYDITSAVPNSRFIVFNQTNNPGWQAKLNGVKLEQYPANVYANGFLVPGQMSGELIIEYVPQRTYFALTWVAVVGIVISGSVIIYQYMLLRKVQGSRHVSIR